MMVLLSVVFIACLQAFFLQKGVTITVFTLFNGWFFLSLYLSNLVGQGVHDFVHGSIDNFSRLSVNIVLAIDGLSYHLQAVFFAELYPSETRKLIERLINYVIYKVSAFLYVVSAQQSGCFSKIIVESRQ